MEGIVLTEEGRESRHSRPAVIGLKILLCGTSLMLFGIAIAARPEFQASDADSSSPVQANAIIARIPLVVGAILALLGGTRMGTGIARYPRIFLGVGFLFGAVAVPQFGGQVLAVLANYTWTTISLMPFFVFRILGIIFIATGLLRAFPGDKS